LARWPPEECFGIAFASGDIAVGLRAHPGLEGSDGLEHLQKELVQVFGPRLLMLLEEEDQFAQQVTFTERVQAILEAQIAGEEVMHEPTLEPGEDTDGLNGLLTAFEMDGEEGQQRAYTGHATND